VIKILRQWFNRYFSDPEAVLLVLILVIGFSLVIFLSGILAPVLVALVLAYLLEWIVIKLQSWKIPRLPAVLIVFLGFLALFSILLLVLLPLLWKQLVNLAQDLPNMLVSAQNALLDLADKYPEYLSPEQLRDGINSMIADVKSWGKVVISASLSSITSLITWLVYVVLVPLLLFFFLKDRTKLLHWLTGFLPQKRGVLRKVSTEVNQQIGNYIRGKVAEIIIVGIVTFLVFWIFNLRYSVLLAALVGLSVLIPYVGAVVITIPVILVAYLQWGFNSQFGYFILVYLVVQGLDANILVPLLFSEAVNLHPVAIIVATLFFGGIWGFWGVFFAIPLATLVKALLNAWPKIAHT
jgi:putative permease